MNLALDAIKRSATPARRPDILKAIFATKDRTSVLGTYSIDKNGDTTLTDYGVYSVNGRQSEVRPDHQGEAPARTSRPGRRPGARAARPGRDRPRAGRSTWKLQPSRPPPRQYRGSALREFVSASTG